MISRQLQTTADERRILPLCTVSNAHIFFNRPFTAGHESENIQHVLASRKFSGGGVFSRNAELFFKEKFGFGKPMLTPSCTHALEMAALLLDIHAGDEVIMPSFTYVSTANAFALRGAKILFADSCSVHPNIDPDEVEKLITSRTKAIVVVHYAGVSCDMDKILAMADKYKIAVVEDAAHCFNAKGKSKFLGSIGSIGVMSFHETKNVTCGEGGLITINNKSLQERAEVISEKGTNRRAFHRNETDHYSWVDLGSSYQLSEFSAAVLTAQLERTDEVTTKRVALWNRYQEQLKELAAQGYFDVQSEATANGHIYYIVCKSLEERTQLMRHLSVNGIDAVFHYLSLHTSPFFSKQHDGRKLPNSDRFMYCLLRLPMYFDLTFSDIDRVCDAVASFYRK